MTDLATLAALADRADKLSPSDQLRLAAGLLDQVNKVGPEAEGAALELAYAIVSKISAELGAIKALGASLSKTDAGERGQR